MTSNRIPDCSICLQPLHSDIAALKNCGHVFHIPCLDKHINSVLSEMTFSKRERPKCVCPTCRTAVDIFDAYTKIFFDMGDCEINEQHTEEETAIRIEKMTLEQLKQHLSEQCRAAMVLTESEAKRKEELLISRKENEELNLSNAQKAGEIQTMKEERLNLIADNSRLREEAQKLKADRQKLVRELSLERQKQAAIQYFKDPRASNLFGLHEGTSFGHSDITDNPSKLKKVIHQQHMSQKIHRQEYSKLQKKYRNMELNLSKLRVRYETLCRRKGQQCFPIQEKGKSNNPFLSVDENTKGQGNVSSPRLEPQENLTSDASLLESKSVELVHGQPSATHLISSSSSNTLDVALVNPFANKVSNNPLLSNVSLSSLSSKRKGKFLRAGYDEIGRKREFRVGY